MKMPSLPPDYMDIFSKILQNQEKFLEVVKTSKPTDNEGRYLHWEKVRYISPPDGLSNEEWWASMKMARNTMYKKLTFNNKIFKFMNHDTLLENLHWLDTKAAGTITIDQPVLNSSLKNTYIISSLIEESIRSSQLEGAATTQEAAKKMIQQGRQPSDKNEQMIYNNYMAMRFIKEHVTEKLTPEMIKELHRIVTFKTLNDNSKAGNYRCNEDKVIVTDETGEIVYNPLDADEIEEWISLLCKFSNEETDFEFFIHPVIRSITLHFLLSYIHPFVDGNGRTARALFYWSMLKQGYWLTEFISISRVLKEAPAQYAYAFLYTETDEDDLTYFIDHQISVIKKAVDEFNKYVKKKMQELEKVNTILVFPSIKDTYNYRQYTLIQHAIKHPGYIYSISEHQRIHGIAYDTARKDLLELSGKPELLIKIKDGKGFTFFSPSDILSRIEKMKT